ncbi:MAG: hypothetical protein QOH13_913 [Thermoleophilaceae bacterium]|jgi:hypothetical protein|nr:hypothetical protein [Thermoleophilaceae bacterium]
MEASPVPGEERHTFTRPMYLLDRPVALRLVLVVVVPVVFGAICGYFLGHSKTVYLALQVVAAIGGYVAGFEHRSRGEAAVRGLLGGACFGGGILLMHQLTGDHPTVKLPDPPIVLLAFTAGIGAVLGAFGAAARATREESGPPQKFKLDFSLWLPGEYYGFLGSAVLIGSMFLKWYGTSSNPNALINGRRGTFDAFQTFKLLDILLVAACAAPFILAWIVARGHALEWRPGEVTMIVGMTAFVLILLNGIVLGKPGGPDSEIQLKIGWFVGLLGAAGICAAGVLRQAEQARDRKPPGVL